MTIDVKFNSNELADKLRSGTYELPEDATVSMLLETAQNEVKYKMSQELTENLVFLFNNRHAVPETVLSDNGKLRVLHKVLGG